MCGLALRLRRCFGGGAPCYSVAVILGYWGISCPLTSVFDPRPLLFSFRGEASAARGRGRRKIQIKIISLAADLCYNISRIIPHNMMDTPLAGVSFLCCGMRNTAKTPFVARVAESSDFGSPPLLNSPKSSENQHLQQ